MASKSFKSSKKSALVDRGGWGGHQPVEATEMFIPFLEESGFNVRVEESPAVFTENDFMDSVDLIVQTNTILRLKKKKSWDFDWPLKTVPV
jgi:type 1 glutamine amidotransferase